MVGLIMASLLGNAKAVDMKEGTDIVGSERAVELSLLESLYRRYAAQVYTICLRLLSSVRAAEEATVAVFVRFGREATRRLGESDTLVRLRELSIEEALTRLKVRGRKAQSHDRVQTSPPRTDERPPLDAAAIDTLASQLPDHLRVAFVLRDREGLSDRAIASHLRINEAEVRRLVALARQQVRRLWLS